MGESKKRFIELLTPSEPSHCPSNDPEESQCSPTGSIAIAMTGRKQFVLTITISPHANIFQSE
jgi:hypothetical protein